MTRSQMIEILESVIRVLDMADRFIEGEHRRKSVNAAMEKLLVVIRELKHNENSTNQR